MKLNKTRWLCGWMVLCLLLSMFTVAMAEGEPGMPEPTDAFMTEEDDLSVMHEEQGAEAEDGVLEIGDLALELDAAEEPDENNGEAAEIEYGFEEVVYGDEGELLKAEANAGFGNSSVNYGRVIAEESCVFSDKKCKETIWTARQGDVVLVTGEAGKMASVAFVADTGILVGYMSAADVEAMTREEVVIYQAEAAAGEVVLYQDDVNWPLKANNEVIASNSGNYTDGQTNTAYSSKTLYKEDCTYKVVKAFNWHTGPSVSTSTSGSASVGDTFTTDAVIWNTTTNNMWVKKKGEEKYVFAGLHYANSKWYVDNSQTQYLSFVNDNSKTSWNDSNLQGTLEQGKSFTLKGTLSSSATMTYAVGEFYKNKSCWGNPTANISINSTSYSMASSELDRSLKFGSLSTGDYSLVLHIYSIADRGQKQKRSDIERSFSIGATPSQKYYLDLNGWINGKECGDLANAGTVDVYINGNRVADDVTDYYVQWPAGTSYEIKDITGKNGYKYAGVQSGATSGTIGSGTTKVVLFFVDRSAPQISNIEITDLTPNGYTVTCTVSDNVGVTKVQFPTWYDGQQGEDATWHNGTISGNTATCQIKVSDHNNKRGLNYHTDIYAWDAAGNRSSAKARYNYVPGLEVAAISVSLNKSVTTMTQGGTMLLTATVLPENAVTSLKWTSSDEDVAFVDSNGIVAAVGEGTATITVTTANGKSATCEVTVKAGVKPKKVKLNKTKATVVVGATLNLKAKLTPSNAGTTLTWTSSNNKVATVSDTGVVTAKAKGTAKITVSTANGKKATCKVTVPKAPTKIKFAKKSYSVKKGKNVQLYTKLTSSSAKTTLTWSSSDTSIATVNSKGKVKGKNKGTVYITVTTANGLSATVKVKVK